MAINLVFHEMRDCCDRVRASRIGLRPDDVGMLLMLSQAIPTIDLEPAWRNPLNASPGGGSMSI